MGTAPKTGNEQGDTPSVDRNIILLAWQMELPEYKKDEKGGKATKVGTTTKAVKADSELYYSEALIKWFDIPVYTGSPASAAEAPKQGKRI